MFCPCVFQSFQHCDHLAWGRESWPVCFSCVCLFCDCWFVSFLFLLVSGIGCSLWLWHSLDFSFYHFMTGFCTKVGSELIIWYTRQPLQNTTLLTTMMIIIIRLTYCSTIVPLIIQYSGFIFIGHLINCWLNKMKGSSWSWNNARYFSNE